MSPRARCPGVHNDTTKEDDPPLLPRNTSNILTFDVEDWFHILESDGSPDRSSWSTLENRVEANTDKILEMLSAENVKATFFIVGWVAQQNPEMVRRIAAEGHEIGSHSFWHEVMRGHTRDSLRADLESSRKLLQDLSGQSVEGFRAPGGSITPETAWSLELIQQAGFSYDSSLCPGVSSHGGFPSPYLGPHLIQCSQGTIAEIPSATIGLGSVRTPYAGGGYLRLFPLGLISGAISLDNALGRPTNIYVHPREIDPEQPRMDLPFKRRFKYYVGLDSTLGKLQKLIRRHSFTTAAQWLIDHKPWLTGKVLDIRELARSASPVCAPEDAPPVPALSA